jgi:hypothetical protein
MRFLLGVLLGYSMRGKKRPLITVLTALAFILYVLIPGIALLALRLDVQRERQIRPTQVQVPVLKGLNYKDAETKPRFQPELSTTGDSFRSSSSGRAGYRSNSTTWRKSRLRLSCCRHRY